MNTDDQKSTFGYIFIVASGAITWRSKKQETIALSSMEAEYIALSEVAHKACWLRNLYNELGFLEKTLTIIKGTMTDLSQWHGTCSFTSGPNMSTYIGTGYTRKSGMEKYPLEHAKI